MATPSKAALLDQLRELRVEPPPNASSVELQQLVKKVKALPPIPATVVEKRPPAVAPPPSAPPLKAPRPLVSPTSTVGPTTSSNTPESVLKFDPPRPAAVAPPPSDSAARPWDPFAGT